MRLGHFKPLTTRILRALFIYRCFVKILFKPGIKLKCFIGESYLIGEVFWYHFISYLEYENHSMVLKKSVN